MNINQNDGTTSEHTLENTNVRTKAFKLFGLLKNEIMVINTVWAVWANGHDGRVSKHVAVGGRSEGLLWKTLIKVV